MLRTLPVPGQWIGSELFAPVATELGLQRCLRCALAFVNPRPSDPLLDRFYSGEAYVCHAANDTDGTRRKADFVLDRVRAHAPRARRLLDFGAGGGWLVRRALERGYDAIGYDIGARSLRTCRDREVPIVERLDRLPRGGFDAIILHHVFEHFADVAGTLATLRRLLAAGGRLFLEVPNAGSLRARLAHPELCRRARLDERYRAFPIHLYYFEARSLRAMLERYAVRVVATESYGLGIDELFRARDGYTEAYAPSAPLTTRLSQAAHGRAARRVKQLIKDALYERMLGESLLAVATHP